MNNKKNIELLSPAGSMDSLYAAVNAGCNAVYIGGKQFSARASAANFSNMELEEAIDYCHLRGVKVYITVNTLYKQNEVAKVLHFIEQIYTYGVDAIILQDIGIAQLVVENFPDLPIHASTQMTAHSLSDVNFLEESGFSRVVLARELSLKHISEITKNCNVEIEIFAHGALCNCYSGRCLMSSFIGGRSGNRGNCAQPCRRFYTLMKGQAPIKTGYLLSPKDLMSANFLEEIVKSKVNTIKIEGRMKNPEYVYQVTKTYSTALENIEINETADLSREILRNTAQVFNRGGFTEGYFKEDSHSGFPMMATKSPKSMGVYIGKVIGYDVVTERCKISVELPIFPGDGLEIITQEEPHAGGGVNREIGSGEIASIIVHGNEDINVGDLVYRSYDKRLMDDLARETKNEKRTIDVTAYCQAKIGNIFLLRLNYDGIKVEIKGDIVEKAMKQPTTSEKIIEQLSKTGGTTFNFSFDKIEIDDNIFMSISVINEIRRKAVAELSQKLVNRFKMTTEKIEIPEFEKAEIIVKRLTISVMDMLQLEPIISRENKSECDVYLKFKESYLDDIDNLIQRCKESNIKLFLSLPEIEISNNSEETIRKLEKTDINGYLIRTFGQLSFLKSLNTKKTVVADYHFNISNKYSYEYLLSFCDRISISTELNFSDISLFADKSSEIIVFGKPVLMITQQCPVGLYAANKGLNKHCKFYDTDDQANYYLKDNSNVSFPIITECSGCYAQILNDRPIFMANKMKDINNSPVGAMRLAFTNENAETIEEILSIYYKAINTDFADANKFADAAENGFTYGHFYRGSV